jgi:4-hydroxy 2-oxovalerate aldolase
MNEKIKILDCTLRDGGYINDWEFSYKDSKEIIESLVDANINIIECGFVSQSKGNDENSTLFKEIDQVNNILKEIKKDLSENDFCIMINKGEYKLKDLPQYDSEKGFISIIRYAFHKKDWREAISDIEIIQSKGYKVFVQAMVTLSYSDIEILELIEAINSINVYAMYIVDSFGAMFGDDFRRLHYLFEHNLKEGIQLGYHSHNNLQLAYSNAIDFIQFKNSNREIVIDSSIHGMGRGAGNLTTELLADYLNKKKGSEYKIVPLLESIDKYIEAIYRENYWGYSIAHFLSASFFCHPNYATYLVNKKNLTIVSIQSILSLLTDDEKKNFNKDRIEELYYNFKSRKSLKANLNENIFKNREIFILAPGPNSVIQKEKVIAHIQETNPIVIAVNHIPEHNKTDYTFFSNQKRYERFLAQIVEKNTILTNNIHVANSENEYNVVDYHDLVFMMNDKNDNVMIILLKLLIKLNIKEVSIAGFDGYHYKESNYNYPEYDRILEKKELEKQNEHVISSLQKISKKINLNFITDSIYES